MSDTIKAQTVENMNKAANEEGAAGAGLRKRIQSVTQDILAGLAREMLDKADDALFELANKADSNVQQQLYFDAMRDIRIKRGSIEKGFRQAMDHAFEEFSKGKVLNHETLGYTDISVNTSLELIGDEDMELSIAVFNMAEKQERQFYQSLYEITARVGQLYQHGNLQLQQHPLSPVAIASAFGDAIRPLDIEFQVKLIIYKLFDRYVMPGVGVIYQDLNTILIRAGVLPKVFHTIKRSTNFYRSKPNAQHVVGESAHSCGPGYGTVAGDDWETVPVDASAPVYDFGMPGFSVGSGAAGGSQQAGLLNTLSALQGYIRQNGYPEQMRPAMVGRNIIKGLHDLGLASVSGSGQSDEKIINTMSMIFDYILDDANIPEELKGTLARLQIPFLKLALLEKDFLGQKEHPARILLNEMAKASIGWTADKDLSDLPARLDTIVNAILEGYQKDGKLFVKLHSDFREYLKENDARNHIFEERTRQTMEGKERIQYAKNRIEAWLTLWSSREGTPKLITTFLRHIWKSTMLYLMHRFGEDSKEWRYHIKLINALLWSVQPGKNEQEVTRLVRILPNILRGLQRGMLLVSTHNKSMQAFFEGLSDCHANILREGFTRTDTSGDAVQSTDENVETVGENIGQIVKSAYKEMPMDEEDAINVIVDTDLETVVEEVIIEALEPSLVTEEEGEKDHFDGMAIEMQCGTWVEFEAEEGEKIRAKLAWRSELSGKCLFVGRNGMKVAERTLAGLAAELRGDRCRMLDGQPLLDRAIDAITTTLKTEADTNASA